jgi:PhnB protein
MARKKPARKATSRKAAKPAARKVSPIPRDYHSLTPYLVCRNSAAAIEFYKKAFGAKEKVRMNGPDGSSVMHAELQIGDSRFMLGDENPQMSGKSPETLGGSPAGIMIYTPNVDKVFAKAVAAGATAEMPPMDMFWGDRYGTLRDPFGHRWSIATHTEDVTPREMRRRSDAWMKQQASAGAQQG